ncbi:hypothetical protein [Acinetobacter schindleri]|uniref:hypothetical protein n=1 Tax=Acinetobacter schindleri TaxID=108981 RepID=UPI0013B0755A|nr:hypothetical protein [Acinetobacter schindleri]QIC64401.1 hypothetical protein FSC11_08485 [Acinetobacter schindleri]
MPIAKHVSLLVDLLNTPVWSVPDSEKTSWSFKHSHGYDLLACMCDLNKYDFERIGFVSSSLMSFVPTYQPYSDDLNLEVLNAIRQKIKDKLGFTEDQKHTLDIIVDRVTRYGFMIDQSIVRHPDQLTAMVRELYESEESILEHLDNLIELIENLTYALDHKKGKKLQPIQYWLLHWCYATLFKHQTALEKQIIAENRIPSKSKALLSVYKPYFDNAYPALKKYYQICLELKFDQAMELHNKLNSFLGSQYYETTHSFAVTSQKTEPEIFVSNGIGYPYYENTTNLFYRITETGLGLEKGNSFYEVLDSGFDTDLSEEEQAILTYVKRLFRKDDVGYELHFEDGGFIDKYTYLFSDDFLKEAQERYKAIMPWTLKNIVETRAKEIYSHMYRHYIKHKNFDSYSLPNITRTVEPLKYSK